MLFRSRQLQLRHRIQEPVRAPSLALPGKHKCREPREHVRSHDEGRDREEERGFGWAGRVAEHHRHDIEERGQPRGGEPREDALRREAGRCWGDEGRPLQGGGRRCERYRRGARAGCLSPGRQL